MCYRSKRKDSEVCYFFPRAGRFLPHWGKNKSTTFLSAFKIYFSKVSTRIMKFHIPTTLWHIEDCSVIYGVRAKIDDNIVGLLCPIEL